MENKDSDLIALEDSHGNELAYEILDVVPFLGKEYAVLFPVDDESDEPELVILELMSGVDDEDEELHGVDDPDILDAVFKLFLEREKEAETEGK
jgi:uncharacterized protein YrzB (UPF0473 family)